MEAFISQTQVSYECPNEIIYEKKLDTALRDTFLTSFEERYENNKLSTLDKVMLSHIPKHLLADKWDKGPTYMGFLLRKSLSMNKNSIIMKDTRRQHTILMNAMIKTVEIQLLNIIKNYEVTNKQILVGKIRSKLASYDIPSEVRALIHFSSWLTKVLDQGAKCRRRKGKMSEEDYYKYLSMHSFYAYDEMGLIIIFGEGINVVILGSKIWVMPYAGVTLIQNKIADTISVLLFAYFSSGTSLPENAYAITLAFIEELGLLLIQYKNQFFTIAKGLESLCVAESIVEHEDWNNTEFLRITANDIFHDTGFDYLSSKLREYIKTSTTPFRHQLCCLGKLLGHPYVDMRGGAESLFKKTTEHYELNLDAVNNCLSHIKLNYIRNHVMRHKRWPPCTLSYGCSMALTQAFVRSKDPYDSFITKKYGPISLSDMNFVTLEKNDRFYKLENVIPYLKDKTVSLLRSKVLRNVLHPEDGERPKWEETRLLLAFLLNPALIHNHVDYIEKFESSADLEELLDYLVIRIVPKEKELKIAFRGFGCKTYEDRFRALAQEKNAMRFLDDYSDEQAMTLSELEILRRLNTFRNLHKAYPGHKILYINIDASSWNNHFRKETVDQPMKETLDRIFGTSIFGKTHLAYEKTLFYVPGYPQTFLWEGQAGGIEGLNQDTWVIVYLGQIKTALDGLGFKYHCLCKGDDLRVTIAVPPHVWKNREMSNIKNDIVSRIANTMGSFGHQIKVLESYGSSKYFSFSKNASIEDVELPQGYRKIQKCYGASNALIATLDEYIGSTFSNAHSTCKVEPIVLPAYLVAVYWSLTYLITHPTYRNMNADELTGLMLIPSLAGGFPIIYLHNMPIRAESDLLSPFLDIYMFCRQYYPSMIQIFENFMHAPIRTRDDDPVMLYKDPYSLPHDRPPLPSAVLRRFIVPILRKYAKREEIRELLDACNSIEMEIIKQLLKSASVFNAKILSALYASTPEGILEELVRKFESARSINEFMIRTVGPQRSTQNLRRVVRAERKLQIWRANRVKGKNLLGLFGYSHLVGLCPAEAASRIRHFLWGREIVGITMPPLQHQVVMMTAFAITENQWVNENHFTYTISNQRISLDNGQTDHYASGVYKPFLGYSTRNGMTEPTLHFLEKDPMLIKIKNLLDLVTWTNLSQPNPDGSVTTSNCPELIKLILGSYTSTPLDQLAPFSGIRRSGTIQHHVRAPSFREAIVPNVLSNVYTRVLGESNTHIRYRTSKHHFYVNFLHIYCYSIWACMLELEFSPKITTPEKVWTVSSSCSYCNRMIVDEPIVFNMEIARGVHLHPLAVSQVGKIAENILRASLDASKDIDYNVDTRDISELPLNVAYQGVLQEIMEQTYLSRIAIQTRYDTPVLSDDAYQVLVNLIPQNRSRDVGQSEIKRIPIYDLAVYVSVVVLHFSGKMKGRRIKDSRDSMLSAIPGESLPWYGLINQIHKAGKLPQLILHFSRFLGTPHATCFYNPVTASRFICRYAHMLIRFLKPDRPLVILSYYTVSHLNYSLELLLTEKILVALKNDIGKYMPRKSVSQRLRTSQQESDLLTLYYQCIILLSTLHNVEAIAEELSQVITDHQYQELVGVGLDFLDVMMIAEFCEVEDGYQIEIQEWLNRWNEIEITLEMIPDDLDWENVLVESHKRYESSICKIHYTNIGACCLAIRGNTESDPEQSNEVALLPFQQIPSDPDLAHMNQMDRPCIVLTGIDYTEPVMQPAYDQPYVTREMTSIPLHEAFCTLGSATGSETHLLYILYNQGKICKPGNPTIQATCFGDGYGGFTSILLMIYPHSSIIYHTLPEDNESAIIASVATEEVGGGQILSKHLDEGYTSLSIWATFTRLLKYEQVNDFVTSDVELDEDNLHEHRVINSNIIRYYLITRTRECWCIIKLSVCQADDIATFIDIGLHFCLFVCLHSPRSNDSSRYVYLILRGWRKSYDEEMFEKILQSMTSNQAAGSLNRYYKQVRAQWRKYHALLEDGVDISTLDPGFRLHPSVVLLGVRDRLPSLLLSDFDFPIIIEELEGVAGSMPWKSRMFNVLVSNHPDPLVKLGKELGINTTRYISSLWAELKSGENKDVAAHRHAVLCRIFKTVGFRSTIHSFGGFNTSMIIKKEELQHHLTTTYNMLEQRDQRLPTPSINLHDQDTEHEGMIIRYVSSYRRGISIGLVLLGSLSMFMQLPGQEQQISKRRNDLVG